MSELSRAQPNISLSWIASSMPFESETEREHYLEGFRRAGLTSHIRLVPISSRSGR
jgi:hypothetical protein